MKKQLYLALILIFAISSLLMAGTPRTYIQRCSLDTGLEAPVTNTGTTHNPDYIIRATCVETSEVLGSDLGTPAGSIRISRVGISPNFYTAAALQLGTFPTQWVAGQTINMYVKYVPTNEEATWSMVIPAGGTTINIQDPIQVIPPYSPAGYNLTVTSTPAGATILKDGATTGQVTPYTFTPGEAGTYTLAPMAGYTPWTPAEHVVPALTADTTIDFQATEISIYNYTLNVNGPPDGYAVTGPVAGTLPYIANDTDNDGTNDLIGSYEAGPAPDGRHWAVNPIAVTADMFTLQAGKAASSGFGSKKDGAKAVYNYAATITFVLEPNVVVIIPGDPLPNGVTFDGTTYTINQTGLYSLTIPMPVGFSIPWYIQINTVPPTVIECTADPFTFNFDFGGAKAPFEFTPLDDPPSEDVLVPGGPETVVGGTIPAELLGPDTGLPYIIYTVTAAGTHDMIITLPAGYTYCWTKLGANLVVDQSANIVGLTCTIPGFNFDAKGVVTVILNDNPTLPVELSSFTGVMTAEYFVQLNWITQSETNLAGYRVLRSESSEIATAINMTPVLITPYNESTTHSYNFTDAEVENHTTYNYWLESVEMDGSSEFHGPVPVRVEHEVPPVVPTQTAMRNAYPNPFFVNGNTTIEVAVKEGDAGTVTIYNVLGQAVQTYSVNPGNNSLTWNGRDSKGNTCGSGIYFYRLSTPSMNKTMKMVILK